MVKTIFFAVCILILLAGCAAQTGSEAVTAVEQYYKALIERNEAGLASVVCADWEEQALLEFDSFAGVTTALDGVTCSETGTQDGATLVTCSGKIVATYGNEQMDFPLDEREHRVVNEAGDWRVCGY